MYLADSEITARLQDLSFVPEPGFADFDPAVQVQPSSIDLRLGVRFWIQRRGLIDLRQSRLMELRPRRFWRSFILRDGESFILRPGEMVLARTLEEFSMPSDLCGMIVSRSSFARLGLSIHCSDGYINPGWRGRMPLQLVNHSRTSIRIVPGISIGQLLLSTTAGQVVNPYGSSGLASKYIQDDGGPSYWWRDKIVERVLEGIQEKNIEASVVGRLSQVLTAEDIEVIDRFERFIGRRKVSSLLSEDELLQDFARSEDRRQFAIRVGRMVSGGSAAFFLAGASSMALERDFGFWLWFFLTLAAISSIGAFLVLRFDDRAFLTSLHLSSLATAGNRRQ